MIYCGAAVQGESSNSAKLTRGNENCIFFWGEGINIYRFCEESENGVGNFNQHQKVIILTMLNTVLKHLIELNFLQKVLKNGLV